MTTLSKILLYILVFDIFLLILGLLKPGIVVWWEDLQNRRRVIRIYGRMALLLWAAIFIIEFFNFHLPG